MDALEDFDFGEEARPNLNAPTFGARPAFGRRVTADDGSALFGGLTSSFDDSDPSSPVIPASSPTSNASMSPPASPSLQADLATSLAEPLGPRMSKSSHLTDDGFVEAVSEVDGSTIRVPADDVSCLFFVLLSMCSQLTSPLYADRARTPEIKSRWRRATHLVVLYPPRARSYLPFRRSRARLLFYLARSLRRGEYFDDSYKYRRELYCLGANR